MTAAATGVLRNLTSALALGVFIADANHEVGEQLDIGWQHATNFGARIGQNFADLGEPDLGFAIRDGLTGGFDGYQLALDLLSNAETLK